jgi:hypothetical protein
MVCSASGTGKNEASKRKISGNSLARDAVARMLNTSRYRYCASQPSTVRSGTSLLHALRQAVHSNGFDDRADQISGAQRGD